MQNIDYSRRLRQSGQNYATNHSRPSQSSSEDSIFFQKFASAQSVGKSSFLYLFIGAVLLFTSGLVIGLKIDQKENTFANNETHSFRNVNNAADDKIKSKQETKESGISIEEPQKNTEIVKPQKTIKKVPQSVQSGLKFPPKPDKMNYLVQLGTSNPNEAIKFGKTLVSDKPELAGRLFKTSTGKLYLGYFYTSEEAKKTLSILRSKYGKTLDSASIKQVQF
ncbi:MAG: hypothetical protein K8R21_06470 [Leptospira sp.]|nr:hypothetical protein [Leptospira sp.]